MAQISLNELIGTVSPSYPENIAGPFREELTQAGFVQLTTPAEVEQAIKRKDGKIVLMVLNSVCGCAAKAARPGVLLSLFNQVIPHSLVTIFAGMEKEAVAYFRQNFLTVITPSSPNIAVFKDGELLTLLQRHQIEGKSAGEIADELIKTFNKECNKQNTSEAISEMRSHFMGRYQVDPLGS